MIVPAKRRVRLREVWSSFAVGRMLGGRDIKVKYKQSALGPLWLVLQPLGMLVAVSVAFSAVTNVSTGNVPYVVFAIVGLTASTSCSDDPDGRDRRLPMNASVVRRSSCPRVALVTGALIATLPPLIVMLPISFVAALATVGLPTQVVLLPAMIAWLHRNDVGHHTLRLGALRAVPRHGRLRSVDRSGGDLPDPGRLPPQSVEPDLEADRPQPHLGDHRGVALGDARHRARYPSR